MYKIAAMGDKSSIYGFASLGVEIFPAQEAQTAEKTLHKLAADGYAVIFITEGLAEQIQAETEKYKDRPLPAIIPIPSSSGGTGYGMRQVSRFVERAVGSDIVS